MKRQVFKLGLTDVNKSGKGKGGVVSARCILSSLRPII